MKQLFILTIVFLLGISIGYMIKPTLNLSVASVPSQTLPIVKEPLLTQPTVPANKTVHTQKPPTNFMKQFEQQLHSEAYEEAIEIYNQQHNNDTKEQYQRILFTYVKDNFKQTPSIKTLLNLYLQYEYNDTVALLLLSKIHLKEKAYLKAIKILQELKLNYVEASLQEQVDKNFTVALKLYLDSFKNPSKEKLQFLEELYQNNHNDFYLYLLALEHLSLYQYEQAIEFFQNIEHNSVYYQKAQAFLKIAHKKLLLAQKFMHKIKLKKQNNQFYLQASINGKSITLLIDTGATYTLINKNIIKEEDLLNKEKIPLNTANGTIEAYVGQIESFKVNEDIELNNLQVALGNLDEKQLDGLLGMSFLKHFDFYIDQEEAILYLK
jgi:clan AA aspartic protease (TIGR02281 family)